MAKGKHATALFEVIHSKPRSSGNSAKNALLTPKWWFKGRSDPQRPTPVPAPSFSPTPAHLTEPTGIFQAPAESSLASHESAREEFQAEVESQPPLGRSAVQLHFDRDRHEMTLRLRYTTAIVSAFALLVALGLAYVVGRHIAGGPQTASASPTTDELLHGPTHPDVIDIPRHPNAHSDVAGNVERSDFGRDFKNPARHGDLPNRRIDRYGDRRPAGRAYQLPDRAELPDSEECGGSAGLSRAGRHSLHR